MSDLRTLRKAVDDYFRDMSRPRSETKEGLEEVAEEISVMVEALEEEGEIFLDAEDE